MLSLFPSIVDAKAIERLNNPDAEEEESDKRMLPITKIVVEALDTSDTCLSVISDRYGWNNSQYRSPDPKSPLPPDTSPANWLAQRTLTATWLDTLEQVREVNRDLTSGTPHRALTSPYRVDWTTRSASCSELGRLSGQVAGLAQQALGRPPDLGIDDAVFMRTASEIKPLKQWGAADFPAWPRSFVDDTLDMLKADWARRALDVQQSYCYEAGSEACKDSGMWLLGVLLSRFPKAVSDPGFRTAASVLRVSGAHCFVYGRSQSAVRSGMSSTMPRGRMLDYEGFVSMRDAAFADKGVGGAETYEQAMDRKSGFLGSHWSIRRNGKVMPGEEHCLIASQFLREPEVFRKAVR